MDEYQDTNPIQEKLIERLCRFGANLCVVGDDDQTIYQWRGSAVSNILSFTERQARRADGHAGRQLPLLAGDRRARPGCGRAQRPGPAAEEHGRGRAPDLRARRHARADLRLGRRRGGVDLRPDRAAARDPVHRLPGRAAARAVLVGLRGAVPVGVQGRGRAGRRAAAAVDPVRDQGAYPAVRRTRGTGLRRLLPVRPAGGPGGRRGGRVARAPMSAYSRASLEAALPILEEARNWQQGERWGTYNIQRTYLRFLEALEHPGGDGAVVRRRRRGHCAAASWSSTTSASSARRSPTSSRSTSSPRRRPSTTRS